MYHKVHFLSISWISPSPHYLNIRHQNLELKKSSGKLFIWRIDSRMKMITMCQSRFLWLHTMLIRKQTGDSWQHECDECDQVSGLVHVHSVTTDHAHVIQQVAVRIGFLDTSRQCFLNNLLLYYLYSFFLFMKNINSFCSFEYLI